MSRRWQAEFSLTNSNNYFLLNKNFISREVPMRGFSLFLAGGHATAA